MKTCCDTLIELNQWHKDAMYVIGIMARRNAYFTEWDVTDIVGPPPGVFPLISIESLLLESASKGLIREATCQDYLVDGSKRTIWIGATAKEA